MKHEKMNEDGLQVEKRKYPGPFENMTMLNELFRDHVYLLFPSL
jgi:hypothetical protein